MAQRVDGDRERRRRQFAFEEIAEDYDAGRPGYPEALFDEACRAGALGPGDPLLDVGAGTGIATAAWVARGLDVTALEPGAGMRAVGQRTLGERVAWVGERFEDFRPPRRWRAIASAQAFHWVPPEARTARAAALLEPGGVLAILWNDHAPDCPFRAAAEPVYREVLGPPPVRSGPDPLRPDYAAEIRASPQLDLVGTHVFPWETTYRAEALVRLVRTYSDTIRLDEPVRRALLDGLTEVVEAAGGAVRYRRHATLVLGRRVLGRRGAR